MIFLLFIYIFLLFAITRVIGRYREGSVSFWELIFWMAVWLSAGILFSIPSISVHLAVVLGVGRGADVAVYSAIILLFYLIFRLYVKISYAEREITRLVRALAIKDVNHHDVSSSKKS